MGRCRSHENMEYKSKIMEAICDNSRLVRLLTPDEVDIEDDDFDSTETLPFKYLLPYDLIAGTTTTKGRYVSFDIVSTPNTHNNIVKDMVIKFDIICHNDLIQYPDLDMDGYSRCWWDLVVCELDEMFCGDDNSVDIGVGRFEIMKNEPYFVSYAREIPFNGRTLTIKTRDYTDGKRYGK